MKDTEILLKYEESENKKICPMCEMENKDGYEFCKLCGSELVGYGEYDNENPYKNIARIFIILVALFFILIIFDQIR